MKETKIIKEPIYKNGCWGCKRAQEEQEYVCPKLAQHWEEYEKYEYLRK